jgi:PiT family inorganic phosphate transporter
MAIGTLLFLFVALAIALGFEAINGFHDTANAVATVIYTRSLRPQVAVIWSGLMNFSGVLLGGIAVAFSIVHLLPVDLLVHIDTGAGFAMVMALLLAAILWNFSTWYLAIPASSSHTLIGAILGVGLTNALLAGRFGDGVNWQKAGEVGLSLFLSPLVGFALAAVLLLILRRLLKNPALHAAPIGDKPPPWWMRGILILTCSGVSFAHGSNDGQKGIGLIMLILIGLVPVHYAINMDQSPEQFRALTVASRQIQETLNDPAVKEGLAATRPGAPTVRLAAGPASGEAPRHSISDLPGQYQREDPDVSSLHELLDGLQSDLEGKETPADLTPESRWQVRTKTLQIEQALHALEHRLLPILSERKATILGQSRATLRGNIEYAPTWVLAAVALALGLGTMVGWKRIVVTVGEKIGKTHLTYSQGAAAELVAMTTIGMADVLGMPVSTTHVLSSGVAGTMTANRSGLQLSTVRSIALAWVLTLPVSMALAGLLFLGFRLFI